MATNFLELSPGRRSRLIRHVRDAVLQEAGLEPDPVFPSPSETWIERMESALADLDYSQKTVDDLAQAYWDYLATLPEDERRALRLRLGQFIQVRDALHEVASS